MMSKINAGLMSSDRPDWNTPPEVLARVYRLGPVELDPCSNHNSIVSAGSHLYAPPEGKDGLKEEWLDYSEGGIVYVNHPYGREIVAWVEKCFHEAENGNEIVALVPARTDAKWWQTWATTADRILFWAGRLRFLGAPSSAPFPSAILYWGERAKAFDRAFDGCGWFVAGRATA